MNTRAELRAKWREIYRAVPRRKKPSHDRQQQAALRAEVQPHVASLLAASPEHQRVFVEAVQDRRDLALQPVVLACLIDQLLNGSKDRREQAALVLAQFGRAGVAAVFCRLMKARSPGRAMRLMEGFTCMAPQLEAGALASLLNHLYFILRRTPHVAAKRVCTELIPQVLQALGAEFDEIVAQYV